MRRVVEPLLSGGERRHFTDRDLEYARDLGLVAREAPIRIANPIYAEVVPRELTWVVQEEFAQETAWYVDADGGLQVDKRLAAFQAFFREHSEHWVTRFSYQEAGPQLLSCRRSCSASSTVAGASSGSTAWAGAAPIC